MSPADSRMAVGVSAEYRKWRVVSGSWDWNTWAKCCTSLVPLKVRYRSSMWKCMGLFKISLGASMWWSVVCTPIHTAFRRELAWVLHSACNVGRVRTSALRIVASCLMKPYAQTKRISGEKYSDPVRIAMAIASTAISICLKREVTNPY